ncbi:hypothetical protein JKJ11_05905 [Vibrio sp. SCSIO 43133]|uniref:hypothetical protein n=1 Tax=Vibrio sp. SCSIO 43133 TaxID=2802577 RepID=UPI002075C112|nr:hypothetical protein [Vibrio sp. SCSIO 43133]USE01586.1 hypothetical protein JKJ11_05905 [Vibrio sp. SCSIO 43133]
MEVKLLTLEQYISYFYGEHKGALAAFAIAAGVTEQQVTKWINADFTVSVSDCDHQLQSPQKELPKVLKAYNALTKSLDALDDYPFFHHFDSQHEPQPAFITLDIESGAVNAGYSSEVGSGAPAEVWYNLVLRFYLNSALVHKNDVNDFIDQNLSKFQQVLSVFKAQWDDSNLVGRYVSGFQDSDIIQDLGHYIDSELHEDDEPKLTSVGHIEFDYEILNEPLSRVGELEDRVQEYCEEFNLAGVSVDDVMHAAIEYLAQELYSNHTLPVIEAKELNRFVVEGDFDIGAYREELDDALKPSS